MDIVAKTSRGEARGDKAEGVWCVVARASQGACCWLTIQRGVRLLLLMELQTCKTSMIVSLEMVMNTRRRLGMEEGSARDLLI